MHLSDLLLAFGGTDLTDYYVNFINNLNPNGSTMPTWPKYTTASPQLMTLLDGLLPTAITLDTYRKDSIAFLQQQALQHPL